MPGFKGHAEADRQLPAEKRAGSWRAAIRLALGLTLVAAGPTVSADEGCVRQAAERFRLPASLIRAVLQVEGGQVGASSPNRNGSFDIGPMQINSLWLPEIERRGGSLELILHHRCANIHFGGYLLSRELAGFDWARADQKTFWRAVGNYHSHTPALNKRYAERVWRAWQREMRQPRPRGKH